VAQARAGELETARSLLEAVVSADPSHSPAYFWLAALAPTPEQSLEHIDRLLVFNPGHLRAKQLRKLFQVQVKQVQSASSMTMTKIKPTVLIIDGSESARTAAGHILEDAGYSVRNAGSGQQAMENIADDGVPDMIFMDSALPGLDGYQMCSVFQQSLATKFIPIVMFTGRSGFFERFRSWFAGGFAARVVKPYTPDELVSVANAHCPRPM
jgi:twitching motility two-component system response regulator PilG